MLYVPGRPIIDWSYISCWLMSARLRIGQSFFKDDYSAKLTFQVRAASWEACHFRLTINNVSQPDWLQKFMTNICPSGLFGDTRLTCIPMLDASRSAPLLFLHVGCLLALVPIIIATTGKRVGNNYGEPLFLFPWTCGESLYLITLEDPKCLPPLIIIKSPYLFKNLNLRAKIQSTRIQRPMFPCLPLFKPPSRLQGAYLHP